MIENEGKTIKDALDTLKIARYCCRRMFMCHVDVFDHISRFDKSQFPFIQSQFNLAKSETTTAPQHREQMDLSDSDHSDADLYDCASSTVLPPDEDEISLDDY
jgi:hypothetical protein